MTKIKLLLVLLFFQTTLMGREVEITTVGNILPSAKSMIGSQVSGKVKNFFVDVGHEVKKYQPLAQLDDSFYKIEVAQKAAALEAARIELLDAEKDYARMQKLWEKPAGEAPSISLKRFEEAKTKYERASAQVRQEQEVLHRAQLDLEETTIKSPYDGIITKKMADIGEAIPATPITNILEIQAFHPLYLEFSVPQVYASHLHIGSPLHFEIDGIKLLHPTAHIDLFYPILDEATRSLRCRAIINNKDMQIRPGSLARVKITIDEVDSNN